MPGSSAINFGVSEWNTLRSIAQRQSRKNAPHAGRHFNGLGSMWHG